MVKRILGPSTQFCCLLFLAAAAAPMPRRAKTVAVDGGATFLAVNETTHKAYILAGSGISVLDGNANIVATIKTGLNPAGIAVNPVTNRIYAVNQVDGSCSVIDGATRQRHRHHQGRQLSPDRGDQHHDQQDLCRQQFRP